MVVIFGHSPVYGYINTVQEFHFGKLERLTCYVVSIGLEVPRTHDSTSVAALFQIYQRAIWGLFHNEIF